MGTMKLSKCTFSLAMVAIFIELLSNLVYRESSGGLFLISCLLNAVYKFNAIDDIC